MSRGRMNKVIEQQMNDRIYHTKYVHESMVHPERCMSKHKHSEPAKLTCFKQVLHVQTKKYLVPRLPASLNHHWGGGGGGRGPEKTSGQQMICPVSRYQAVFPVVVCECGPAPGKPVRSTRAHFEVVARVLLPSFLPQSSEPRLVYSPSLSQDPSP